MTYSNKPKSPVLSLEEIKKQQTAFRLNPPPCGVKVVFQLSRAEDGQVGSLFWFEASDVQSVAEEMFGADPETVGFRDAAKWSSLRDPSTASPTHVPSMLVTFSQIALKLVESGKGRVKCQLCDHIYDSQVLVEGHRRQGGYFFKTYACPTQHELINTLEMHILLRRDP